MKQQRKKRCCFKLVSFNLRRHNFDFYLSNTVVAADLFVVVDVVVVAVAAAVVVPVVVAVVKDIQT